MSKRRSRCFALASTILAAWAFGTTRAQNNSNEIIGTRQVNISSDSTQMSYYSTWRSDTEDGIYTAYSNASDALATFTFVGVAVDYVAVRKDDRGLCQLTLDGITSYTIDLYDGSGYSQGRSVIWSSGTLEFGLHNVTLSQIGPDARFGFYPYLVTETWVETIPLNATAYTATESVARPSGSIIPSNNDDDDEEGSSNIAPIVGGVIGGVLAALLFAFLLFLWRRDRQMRDRNEGGAPLEKPKKAEGRMAIEDDGTAPAQPGTSLTSGYSSPPPSWGAAYGYPSYGNPGYGQLQQQQMYPEMSSAYGAMPGGHPAYGHVIVPTSNMTTTSMLHQPPTVGSPYYGSNTTRSPPPASHSQNGSSGQSYDPVGYRGVTPDQYPYVVQGVNEEKRMYPVPEI